MSNLTIFSQHSGCFTCLQTKNIWDFIRLGFDNVVLQVGTDIVE